MAKSPRKKANSKKTQAPVRAKTVPPPGGKNLSAFMNNSYGTKKGEMRRSRRFSVAESTSSDSDHSGPLSNRRSYASGSESDSSLTAVSEDLASDISSSVSNSRQLSTTRGRSQAHGKTFQGKSLRAGKGKSLAAYGSKSWRKYTLSDKDEDDDEDDDEDNSSDIEEVSFHQNHGNQYEEGEDADDDEDDDEEEGSSSSDDSDVDFVRLQAQKKIQAVQPPKKKQQPKNQRRGSVSKPRFGRRRSTAAFPDDINFAFELTTYDNAIDDNDDEITDTKDDLFPQLDTLPGSNEVFVEEEEDIGEEIALPIDKNAPLIDPLDFNQQLISAPNFKDDDINSDEDYEFDDNELLATLQADNDLEEFDQANLSRRNNSIGSLEGDEDEFLKEEEKFLVNEFESNGFDEEGDNNGILQIDDKPNRPRGYSSSEYDEDDEYDDFIDFSIPFDEADISQEGPIVRKKGKSSRKNSLSSDDDDDDSYLWNYFFSSDDDSESSDNLSKGKTAKNKKAKSAKRIKELEPSYVNEVEVHDDGYDSGESTDVDSSIPTTSISRLGSQKAKEVLSSKTADYRPPVLGTWIAIESKPFGIIDGLATRSLTNARNDIKAKPRKSIVGTPHDDEALELEELLNISELDYDDENDVKIWRDFNNQKRRVPLGAFRNKSVLHAFSHSDNPAIPIQYNHTSKTNSEFNQRRYSLSNHRDRRGAIPSVPSKAKRRRASKVEALAEGYRPTKSGLFSEQALVDVEETLGDDNDIMALIKGL